MGTRTAETAFTGSRLYHSGLVEQRGGRFSIANGREELIAPWSVHATPQYQIQALTRSGGSAGLARASSSLRQVSFRALTNAPYLLKCGQYLQHTLAKGAYV